MARWWPMEKLERSGRLVEHAVAIAGGGSLQDIDQLALVRPHVKWATTVARLKDLAPALERAFATAVAGVPGPVFVEIPVDLLYDEPLVREWYEAATPKGNGPVDRALRFYLERHARRRAQHRSRSPSLRSPMPASA